MKEVPQIRSEYCIDYRYRSDPKQWKWNVCMAASRAVVCTSLLGVSHALHAGRVYGEGTKIYRQGSPADWKAQRLVNKINLKKKKFLSVCTQ